MKITRRFDRLIFCFWISKNLLDGLFLLAYTILHFILLRFSLDRLIKSQGYRQFELLLNNKTFNLCLRIQDIPVFFEIFQEEAYRFENWDYRDGQMIFDLGAHIGMFSLYYSLYANVETHFLCVEPAPPNLHLLKKNIKLNGIRAIIIEKAMGNNELAHMLLDQARLGYKINKTENGSLKAEVISLTTLMDEFGKPDGIKMDVEGAEAIILNEFNDFNSIQWIWIEIHEKDSFIPAKLMYAGFDLQEVSRQLFFANKKAS